MTQSRIYGPATGVPLGQVEPLLLPWAKDPWDRLRPPLSVEAMRLSAELAGATYRMAVEPWMRAGWQDVTIHVDGELTSLQEGEHWLSARWKKYRVRSRIRQNNPVSQVLGALRQRSGSSTGKAVVMIHPASHGRYVVAVSFMGTGTRFYDWFSNFRMTTLDGVHKGFHQLTRQFEQNEERIEFPSTARELGLEKLTLAHILRDMKSPNSRFLLWLSGHSQGGAVMQVYAHRKIMEDGVLPVNVVGYGFASPSVMTGDAVAQPEAYPLFHVHNSDDLFPRCGAAVHLGMCLTYPSDEGLRRSCYNWPRDEESVKARLAVRPIIRQMKDTPSCIVQVLAYLKILEGYSVQEIAQVLGIGDTLPLEHVLEGADVKGLVQHISRRAAGAYRSITGAPLKETAAQEAVQRMQMVMDELGLRRFTEALVQLMRCPHSISARRDGRFCSAYVYIVRCGVTQLIPGIWQSGQPPVKLIAKRRAQEEARGAALRLPACRMLRKKPYLRVRTLTTGK
ncbi:MAG: hypothetical protein IJZ74_03520 [Clostridia bacterium]|nr:hypothetical protein [Clostridia bacterium]